MKLKEILKIANNIKKWINKYLDDNFQDIKNYGHLQNIHSNKTDDELKCRFKNEYDLECASSFIISDLEIVKLALNELHEQSDEIANFLASKNTDNYTFLVETDIIIGKAYERSHKHDWDDGSIPCTDFVLILKRNTNNNGFHIITGYPITKNFDHWQ